MTKVYAISDDTWTPIRKALEAATVRAALDGKTEDKAAYEAALRDVTRAAIGALPDRPSHGLHLIHCWLTIGELIDIRIGLDAFINNPNNKPDKGWHELRARCNTTIELNTVTKS